MRFSWSYLFTQYGYGDNQDGQQGLRSYPLSNVYSGGYYWGMARLYEYSLRARLWSSTTIGATDAYRLGVWGVYVRPTLSDGKIFGQTLRCSKKIVSWSYLFTQYGYGNNQDGGTGVHTYPLDYVDSGRYYWGTGRLYYQGNNANLWSSAIVSSTDAYSLRTRPTVVLPAESTIKDLGAALRYA